MSGSILWLGPVYDERSMLSGLAVSPAANRWQHGLIRALTERGRRVRVVSYMLASIWPRGPLALKDDAGTAPADVDGTNVGYINAPGLRVPSLARRHARSIRRIIDEIGRPSIVVSYNELPGPYLAALASTLRWRIPWAHVIADATAPSLRPFARLVRRFVKPGRVYLSWADYERDRSSTKLHLDGAAEAMRPYATPPTTSTVVYTGSVSTNAGADLLAQAFARIERADARLIVCGPGRSEALQDLARRDARVTIRGLVSEAELREVCASASVFVNPRLPSAPENINNFPSKLLEYLSYGRPIVSTWTPGLAPEYLEVLRVSDDDPDVFAKAVIRALEDDPVRSYARAEAFVNASRTWSAQAARLDAWLRQLEAA